MDVALTFDPVTGDVKAAVVEDGSAILGFVSRIRGTQDLGPGTTGPRPMGTTYHESKRALARASSRSPRSCHRS